MKETDLAQIFKKETINDSDIYLLNSTLYMNTQDMNKNLYDVYEWEEGDTWFLLSYKLYETIDLWWLICKMNDIIRPIDFPEAGTRLKVLKKDYIDGILNIIRN